jgi:hypothetical protein
MYLVMSDCSFVFFRLANPIYASSGSPTERIDTR